MGGCSGSRLNFFNSLMTVSLRWSLSFIKAVGLTISVIAPIIASRGMGITGMFLGLKDFGDVQA